MEFFSFDFSLLFTWGNMFAIIFGAIFGLFIGVLPGLGPTVGIALLLPLTYNMDPLASILMLVSLYQSAEYGGSISSIVLGIPGNAAAVATTLDGNAMAKQGFPGKALGYSLTSSTIGGLFGTLILMVLAIPLTKLTIKFADPEFFLIGVLGLVCIISLSSKDAMKSAVSVLLGLLLGMIGMDVFTGSQRFTMGSMDLMEGLSMIAMLTGMFAISEVLSMLTDDLNKRYVTDNQNLKTNLTWKEYKSVNKSVWKGSIIGTLAGIIPGLGAGPASWLAYTDAKRSSKNPKKFGKGEPNGIAAPEAANNAVVGGALIPLLTLGIPGSAATAVILSAFMIHGIQPGPQVFKNDPNLIYGIFWGFLVATIAMYYLGKWTTSLWARTLTIPNYILIPIILFAALIGAFAARGSLFDVWVTIIVGVVSFFILKLDYSFPAFILAFVLGPMLEKSLRRSLMLSDGSYSIFVSRGYSIVLVGLIALLVGNMLFQFLKKRSVKKEDISI
ncbi:tripartite tricarboxylate transporter permease [Paenibacillus validus]|uniref:tripartite tricarboxylate transporter permease n=1 Tax=Paenibacillus validus TaxID=44253 RepID=UPI000FD822A6|nr:tripartite tricarboxylate transporter permease [Paenibacillus validus]MED4601380.1 tripartite tricarboxylate transporter permease [Paenibacillus validus]MED4605075.1 tripartite tricarboxylate transporter permease [Paenibacillus validus]